MGWLAKVFGSAKKRSMLDEVKELSAQLIVSRYRSIAKASQCAPTNATTDEEILAIYTKISTAFRQAAEQKGERIPAGSLNAIAWKFMQVKEQFGQPFFDEHLEYEVEKYLREGLRDDYRNELSLFEV